MSPTGDPPGAGERSEPWSEEAWSDTTPTGTRPDRAPASSEREDARVSIVPRDELPAITEAIVDGQVHALGIVKDFRRHGRLARFLPAGLETSFAWVHLGVGEVLEPHVHPTESMIVVARGDGELTGEVTAPLRDGDIVLVPRGRAHGFRGAGAVGFWALSIQFEDRGLYEDESDAWTMFPGARVRGVDAAALEALLAKNREHGDRFAAHRIFTLANAGHFERKGLRDAFLARLQIWSDHFQRLLRLRSALSEHPVFSRQADAHLREELGHNEQFGRPPSADRLWDPVLSSLSTWFVWKTLASSEPERAVLVHLVLEAAAAVFYQRAQAWFANDAARPHFDEHAAVDHAHVRAGVDGLRRCGALDFARLSEVQERGWDVMHAMFDRIVDSLDALPPRDDPAPPG